MYLFDSISLWVELQSNLIYRYTMYINTVVWGEVCEISLWFPDFNYLLHDKDTSINQDELARPCHHGHWTVSLSISIT